MAAADARSATPNHWCPVTAHTHTNPHDLLRMADDGCPHHGPEADEPAEVWAVDPLGWPFPAARDATGHLVC